MSRSKHHHPALDRNLLERLFQKPSHGLLLPKPETLALPVAALMFGEGRFMRAFVSAFFQQANDAGVHVGNLAVIQPIPQGRIEELSAQGCLYTLALQGIDEHEAARDEARIIGSVRDAFCASRNWDRVLRLAADRGVGFLFSNTTEAGIATDPEDRPQDRPPRSFPAKVASLLSHRFHCLGGSAAPGLCLFPCELIEENGARLRSAVAELLERWGAPCDLREWAVHRNVYVSSLVDRIVTGSPGPAQQPGWNRRLGYRDDLLDLAEPFHLWLWERPESDLDLYEVLPLAKAGVHVKVVEDLEPYRDRKVRLLNGTHTALTALGLLMGMETVKQAMDHALLGRYAKELMDLEITPCLSGSMEENLAFGAAVRLRFANPFIAHRLSDISLNTASKAAVRILPALLDAAGQPTRPSKRLCLALAANCFLYRPDGVPPRDLGKAALAASALASAFGDKEPRTEVTAQNLSQRLCGLEEVWGEDLNKRPGLTELMAEAILHLATGPVERALEWAMSSSQDR